MKHILTIGNSFSEDATTHLHAVAESAGVPVFVVNLFIGGCSLQTHWANVETDEHAYVYQENGIATGRMVSIKEVLCEHDWDVVTLQQASHDSGIAESYFPFVERLSAYVKRYAPHAKQYMLQTWAYEVDSDHGGFAHYDRNQKTMYTALCAAYKRAAEAINADIIPCGDVIQQLRTVPEFDYLHGGISLCRDGFHMHCPYGRYATALTLFGVLAGDVSKVTFLPENGDSALCDFIRREVARNITE